VRWARLRPRWPRRAASAAAAALLVAMLGPRAVLAGPVAGEAIDTIAGQAQPFTAPQATAQQPFGLAATTLPDCGGEGQPDPAPSSDLPPGFTVCDVLLVADPVNSVVRSITANQLDLVERAAAGNAGRGTETGATAPSSQVSAPFAVAAGADGIYIADTYANQVRFVDADGVIHLVAGSPDGERGLDGEGGPAAEALLAQPFGIARDDARGVTYVADTFNDRVRAIAADGTITTAVAGLRRPRGLALEAGGTLLIAESGRNAVRRLDPATGTLTTVAGDGTAGFAGDGGPAVAARLAEPSGVAVDPSSGTIYIADTDNHRVRQVSGTVIGTAAGTGVAGTSPDGTPAAAAQLKFPFSVAVLSHGDLVIGDTGNSLVRWVDDGEVRTLAGTGTPSFAFGRDQLAGPTGAVLSQRLADQFCFEGGLAASTQVQGMLLLDTFNHALRGQCTPGDPLFEVLGDGRPGSGPNGPIFRDGPPAQLAYPMGLAAGGPNGHVLIADTFNNVVREIDPTGPNPTVSTVVGTGTAGFAGDGGPAAQAQLDHPQGVAVDAAGNLYVADTYNNRIRKVDTAGVITTIAGTGVSGSGGDGGPAADAQLFFPAGVAVDTATPAHVYVTDTFSHRVRVIVGNTITALAGSGEPGFADGPAATARFDRPWGISVDTTPGPVGPVLYVADELNHRVRVISAGAVGTLTGTGARGLLGDQGPVAAARVNGPRGVTAVDDSGTLLVADSFNNRVRRTGAGALATNDLDFGDVLVGSRPFGTPTFATVFVTNTGTGFLHLTRAAFSGSAAFSRRPVADGQPDCGLNPGLAPRRSCELSVFFDPTAPGVQTGAVTFTDDAGRTAVAHLRGRGVEPALRLTVDGSPVESGATVVFTVAGQTRTLTVENPGTAPLHVTGIALTGSDQFSVAAGNCGLPDVTLPAGGSCAIGLHYGLGQVSATLTMRADDGPAGTSHLVTLTLSGQFTPPIQTPTPTPTPSPTPSPTPTIVIG
jgi:sugar lactone lactonase YvrE